MNDDLISREYVKAFVCEYEKFNGKKTEIVKAVPIQAIDNAPTITPDMALFLAYESGKASAEAKTITPGGRYNGKRALSLLSEIETIARDAFNDPETLDINLYRAQALARIFQLFEYNNEEAADNGEQGSNKGKQ